MTNVVTPNTQVVTADINSGVIITPENLAGLNLNNAGTPGPPGATGPAGPQGPQGTPANTFRNPLLAWTPTALKTADVGTPTQTDTWLDYVTGTALNNVNSNSFSSVNNTFTLTTGQQFQTAGAIPSLGTLFTILLLFKIDTYSSFDHIIEFTGSGVRLYANSTTNVQVNDGGSGFSSGGTIPAATYIPIMIAYGWNNPSSPAANAGIYTIYDGHTGSWVSIGTLTSANTPTGRISFHGDAIGSSSTGTYEYGSLLLFNYQPTATEAINYLTILNNPTIPFPFRSSVQGPIVTDPTLQTAINAAPGTYGGLLRDTSPSSGDESTNIQTQLTANHHITFAEREQRTAEHLFFVDDGYVQGNHATLFGSASYTAVEEDWIMAISATVGGGAFTMNDPLIENLLTDGTNVTGIRDGTNYGNGPPTKTMAGIWFGDIQGKPSAAANSVAHGRVLGCGARNLTYGLRLTGFQYSRAFDGRYEFNDVGILIESANGEGNVDFRVNDAQMGENLVGMAIIANNTQQGFQGPLQNITITGGKHNGQNVGSVCHYAVISPWWRDGVHTTTGSVVIRDVGTEFLLNDAANYYSVGRTFYTKTFDTNINTPSYILGGTSPPPNLDGRPFVQQNANSTWWMCWYVPPCSFYAEGAAVVYDRCRPADNIGGFSGVYRAGPYAIVDIVDPGGAGQFTSRLTVADHPTAVFRFYGKADGLTGWVQNLYRWPDSMLYNGSPFAFFVAGGPLPECELYRVTQGNQPVWHPSSLSTSHQDNISEAVATRSPGFPALNQTTGSGSATTFSVVTATEGIFSGRKVTQMVYNGTVNTAIGTTSAITTANNQPITPTFSVNAPANGRLLVIDNEVFYVISGGGTTTPTLARAQQNTTPATHAGGASVKTVGAFLGGTGQQINTNWLGGYSAAHDPGAPVDSSGFVFIHNTSGTGFWINFDIFWSGNSKFSNGDPTPAAYAYFGRTWVPAHGHARLSFGKGSYESDFQIFWCFDALQPAVTCYVSGLAFLQTAPGECPDLHARMMQRGEWIRNLLQ